MALVALLGMISAVITFVFIVLVNQGINLVWKQARPALGVDARLFTLLACTIGGLLVGLLVKIFGDHNAIFAELMQEFGRTGRFDYRHAPGIVITSLVSLVSGASLGPEAPLADACGGLGTLISDRLKLDERETRTMGFGGLSGMLAAFDRTRLRKFSMLLALVLVALLPVLFGLDSVMLVGDTADIPAGFPRPVVPVPLLDLDLITVGVAVAIIGLVQGAGVSLGYTNPDGKYPDVSRDFAGQGIANLAVSLFQGLPVGGSLSSTALVVSAGARTRLANVFTGLFTILAVVLFAPLIEALPMAGLAAILIVAGVQAINPPRIETVWQTGSASRAVMIFTFIATLALPIQYAVFLGVLLSFVMHIYRSAERVDIVEIVLLAGGRYEERPAPKQLPSNQAILLSPTGSLFFAGAAEFEEDLPEIGDAERTVVLLRLRGRAEIGSSFLRVIARYGSNLSAKQGKLVLVGVSGPVYSQLEKTDLLDQLGRENVYRASAILGDSALNAYQDAMVWLGLGTAGADVQDRNDA